MFEALEFEFERWVAVKVLDEAITEEAAVEDFERECRAMGGLSGHPNIVTVFSSAFTADRRPCIVMELFPHGNYLQILQRAGPLGLEQLLPVSVRVAAALATAHNRGMVHGDVKPQNIFRSQYELAALGDFGIATLVSHRWGDQKTRMSLYYAAPEIIERGVAASSPFADQYSLAATIYTLATGSRPFEGDGSESTRQVLVRTLSEPPPRLGSEFPAALGELLHRAMSRRLQDRFRDLREFAEALVRIEAQLGLAPTAIRVGSDAGRYLGAVADLSGTGSRSGEPSFDRSRERSRDRPTGPVAAGSGTAPLATRDPYRTGDAAHHGGPDAVDETVVRPRPPTTPAAAPRPDKPPKRRRALLWTAIAATVLAAAAAAVYFLVPLDVLNTEAGSPETQAPSNDIASPDTATPSNDASPDTAAPTGDDTEPSDSPATTAPAAEAGSGTAGVGSEGAPLAEVVAAGLAGVCPSPLVVQTDWFPESEHGAIYELVGDDYIIDVDNMVVRGSMVLGGADLGIEWEVRTGGPAIEFSPVSQHMAVDEGIHLGHASTDQQIYWDVAPLMSVVAPLERDPQMIMWDPETYPDVESIADLGEQGITINVFGVGTFLEVFVAQGIWSADQVDPSYDGSPSRFVGAGGSIAQQGFASSEVYTYEYVYEEWGKPVAFQLLHDAGFKIYYQTIGVRPGDLEELRPCLEKLVPIIQQAAVDFNNSPDRANAIIVDAVEQYASFWVYPPDLAEFSVQAQREFGLIGDGGDGIVGNMVPERIAKVLDDMRAAGMDIDPRLTADQLFTNEFIDESIGHGF